MIKFLLKGLIRDRSRSLFPVLMVSAGVFLVVFLYCWLNGVMGGLILSNAQFDTGHVKIMTRAYNEVSEQIPNDLSLLGVNELLGKLRSENKDMDWLPRIRFGGLLDIPDAYGETRAQGPVMGLGIDLLNPDSPEIKILNLNNALVKGRLPEHKNEILISEEFARKLGLKLGETATLISSTMYGAMAMYNFKVVGMVHFGITAMDKGAIIADIRDVEVALDMPDGASEIVGYSKNMMYDDEAMIDLARKFNERYSLDTDEFSPVMLRLAEQNDLGEYLTLANISGSIIVSIFILAMSIVLWNAGLMNGLRRYGEIGVRLAMGEPKGDVYRSMIFESLMIGWVGSIIGTASGLAISYYLQYHGIDFSGILQKSTMLLSNEVRARVNGVSFIIGFFPGMIAPLIGAMIAGIGIYRRQTSQLFKELEV